MITSADLTEAEWESLRELRKGPLKGPIPVPHQNKFILLGLAKKLFSGIVATDSGRRYRRGRQGDPIRPLRPGARPTLRLVIVPPV